MTTTTAPPVPGATAPTAAPGFWRRYGTMWRSTPKDLLVILVLSLIGYIGFAAMWTAFSAGIGLLFALLLGVFVFAAGFYVARVLGELELRLLEWTGRPLIPRPTWPTRPGFLGWLGSHFGSPHSWLYMAYYLLPQFVLAIVTLTLASTAVGIALGGVTWLTWGWSIPGDSWEQWLPGGYWTAVAVRFVAGVAFAFALPYIARGLVWAHWGLARVMLGAFRSDALEHELAGAEASRAAAVSAEDTALRRIERDIHDGPQQRLIRLQMDLASAERRLAAAPEEARALLATAAEQAREALDELRALSRGFAPPILLDRGLVAALESAAARLDVPVDVVSSIPADTVLPPEIERNAYFIASEGLANAVKHSGATRVGVELDLDAAASALVVTVQDDGVGGAQRLPGHGLAGLEERLAGLGGALTLTSPDGGPTRLTARLPW